MTKTIRRMGVPGVALAGLVALAAGCSGGLKSSGQEAYNDAVSRGKSALVQGDAADAVKEFSTASESNPNGCDALWGQVLAGILQIVSDLNPYVEIAYSTLQNGQGRLTARASVDLGSLASVVIAPIEKDLRAILSSAEQAAAARCSFSVDQFPIVLGTDPTPIFKLVLGKDWHQAEAESLAAGAAAIVAAIDFVLAHDWTLDPNTVPKGQNLSDLHNLFLYLRSLGTVYEANPTFLAASPTSWSRMAEVPQLLSKAMGHALNIVPALSTEGGDPSTSVLGLKDENGNGLDGGDEMYVGVLDLEAWSGAYLGPLHVRLPNWITKAKVDLVLSLGSQVQGQLDAVGTTKPHEPLTLAQFNPLLTGLPINVPALPDAVAVDLDPFFTNPKPVRDYLPKVIDPGTGPVFLIEGEVPQGSPAADGAVLFADDAPHFPSPDAIPQDCVYLAGSSVNAPALPYVDYQDAAFNGAVSVNLTPLAGNFGSCAPDPQGYAPATVYSLNKLIAWLIVSYSKFSPNLPSPL